jgi:hypothetical protein
MPNWCNNTLTLEHENPAMVARAKAAFLNGRLLDEFIPVPKSLHIVSGRCGADDNPEQIALEAAQKSNIELHGYKDWYDWCVNEWGTKWDVGGDDGVLNDIEGGIIVSFDSAWAPPTNAYEKLLEQGFKILAMYYEPGMAFAGVWEDGIDDYYEYGGLDSAGIAETLPSALDEAFGISESVAEWEAENAEDDENIDIDLDGGRSATNE